MDPFSVATGIITLLGVSATASQTLKKIRNLREAPELLQAINNEISDLHLAILNVNNYIEKRRAVGADLEGIDAKLFQQCFQVLEQTKEKIYTVDELIRNRILKPNNAVDRLSFLRERNQLIQLQAELRHARQRSLSLFSYFSTKDASRIEGLLTDVYLSTSQTRCDLLQGFSILHEDQEQLKQDLHDFLDAQANIKPQKGS